MEEGNGECDICRLPEACLYLLISFTSPCDACRLSVVCTTLLSAAMSDVVWERFLPVDYQSILSQAINPVEYLSKRELYFRLCKPILIDNGLMSFALEKSSGAKCYMLSARKLSFAEYGLTLDWISLPNSRFAKVAEIAYMVPLEFRGKIESRVFTPRTTYAAYLIFKCSDCTWSLGFPYQETAVTLGAHVSKQTICLLPGDPYSPRSERFYRRFMGRLGIVIDGVKAPWEREDGWMEIEMGEFCSIEGEDGELEVSLTRSLENGSTARGLIIQGIEIRPRKLEGRGAFS